MNLLSAQVERAPSGLCLPAFPFSWWVRLFCCCCCYRCHPCWLTLASWPFQCNWRQAAPQETLRHSASSWGYRGIQPHALSSYQVLSLSSVQTAIVGLLSTYSLIDFLWNINLFCMFSSFRKPQVMYPPRDRKHLFATMYNGDFVHVSDVFLRYSDCNRKLTLNKMEETMKNATHEYNVVR